MEKNIFVVGPEAHGESFFGRKKWLAELSNSLFVGTASISLVGATRIGKSSLVKRVFEQNQADNYLKLYLNISEYGTAFVILVRFWEGIRGELEEHGVMDGYLLRQYARLDGLRQDGEWYTPMNSCIKRILAHIRELDCRMVLAVDEFDGVANVFWKPNPLLPVIAHYLFGRAFKQYPAFQEEPVYAGKERRVSFHLPWGV